jgi:sirohydrochlorin cobaltochelatase
MTWSEDDRQALIELEVRLKTLLPEEYQDSYEDMQPVPMRSAGLKYGLDGKVAWNEIWGSFCDLAMAGGPPHKGTLLEPGRQADIDAAPDRYGEVAEEICRGVMMAALLDAEPSPVRGWVRITCLSEAMAGWLLRAIVMENVAARAEGAMLDLPAAPHFRLEKEIKNVVTVIAKTAHYWLEHMPRSQQRGIASLLARMDEESPIVAPPASDEGSQEETDVNVPAGIAGAIHRDTGLAASSHRYAGWLGVECASVRKAVWMMRALVASNVLSRREGTVLFVPVNPDRDPDGDTVVRSVVRIHRLAAVRSVV